MVNEPIAEQYRALRDELNYYTGHLSNTGRVIRHPAYRKIVDLGKDVIPVILDAFDRYRQTDEDDAFPGHWAFSVLRELSGADLKDADARPGVLGDWIKVWVKWGEEQGYLETDRPKHEKTPPIHYKGWIVVGYKHGGESVLCPKRKPENVFEETHGTAAWVSKVDAARNVDDGWWKKYAWILPTKGDAEIALDILNEKIEGGEFSDLNKPERTWVEELR